jgi:hypothetical protein
MGTAACNLGEQAADEKPKRSRKQHRFRSKVTERGRGGRKGGMRWWSRATFPLSTIMLVQLAVSLLVISLRPWYYFNYARLLMRPHAIILLYRERKEKTTERNTKSFISCTCFSIMSSCHRIGRPFFLASNTARPAKKRVANLVLELLAIAI